MSDTGSPQSITVKCHACGDSHQGDFAGLAQFTGRPIYEVTCTVDFLTDWYNLDAAE